MFSGLLIGTICTAFILREMHRQRALRTPLNILIVSIFFIDCFRAWICAPLESYVLIQTWHATLLNCGDRLLNVEYSESIIDICRFTMAIRSCLSVIQPFGFVAIAYERLRTMITSKGNLNLNACQHRRQEHVRMKNILLWLFFIFFLGIIVGVYQGVFFESSRTCFGQSNIFIRIGSIVRLLFLVIAAMFSAFIYGKIFFIVRRFQRNYVRPIHHGQMQANSRRKDLRSARHTFVIFLSFFLCRIPLMIAMLVGVIVYKQFSHEGSCYYEELSNLATQIIFLATISDPLIFIRGQPKLRQRFNELSFVSIFKSQQT